MSSFPESLKDHFTAMLEILKNEMPSIIDSQEAAIRWGTNMYKVGTFKLTYGIPGEFVCFECNKEVSTPNKYYTLDTSGLFFQNRAIIPLFLFACFVFHIECSFHFSSTK